MIVVAAALLAVLVAGATDIGGSIARGISAAICKIAGNGSCDAISDPEAFLPTCETYSQEAGVDAEATVFSVNIGGNVKMTLTKTVGPDGKEKWVVKDTAGARADDLITFGGGVTGQHAQSSIQSASYYQPGSGMVPWKRCGG